LWNRKIPLKPTIPTRKKNRFLNNVDIDTDKRLYGVLSCILFLTLTISPKSQLKNRIKNLISKYPSVNIEYMGFSGAWEEEDLWK
jgi:abortive infection bacteriophage resistance protein